MGLRVVLCCLPANILDDSWSLWYGGQEVHDCKAWCREIARRNRWRNFDSDQSRCEFWERGTWTWKIHKIFWENKSCRTKSIRNLRYNGRSHEIQYFYVLCILIVCGKLVHSEPSAQQFSLEPEWHLQLLDCDSDSHRPNHWLCVPYLCYAKHSSYRCSEDPRRTDIRCDRKSSSS